MDNFSNIFMTFIVLRQWTVSVTSLRESEREEKHTVFCATVQSAVLLCSQLFSYATVQTAVLLCSQLFSHAAVQSAAV